MRNLLNFLVRFSVVFLFILLEIIALIMLANNKGYQRSVMLSSANEVVAKMYNSSNTVVEFFKLKDANDVLAEENTNLKNELIGLQNKLKAVADSSNSNVWKNIRISPVDEYSYISAKVIRNTTEKLQNYITIDKGKNDGIEPDMGVIGENGVVGIVKNVSPKFAVIIPVLNPKIQISSKFKKTNYTGPIVWDGKDYRYSYLQDVARHVKFNLGDTIITSGLTPNFPEGILVGTVYDFHIKESDAYFNIQVKLAVDFRTLTHVKVIRYENYQEQKTLEEATEVEGVN
jgi:rod shape-determining protein MreC